VEVAPNVERTPAAGSSHGMAGGFGASWVEDTMKAGSIPSNHPRGVSLRDQSGHNDLQAEQPLDMIPTSMPETVRAKSHGCSCDTLTDTCSTIALKLKRVLIDIARATLESSSRKPKHARYELQNILGFYMVP